MRKIPAKLRKSFDKEFKNQKSALSSIKKDAKKSDTMKVLSLKGDTFSSPNEAGVLYELLEKKTPQKQYYLISSPNNPYVEIRSKELNMPNLRNGIINSLGSFNEKAANNYNIKIVQHYEALRFKLIIFDNCLYLSFQPKNIRGRKSPVQRYPKSSSGYTALSEYFESLWEKYVNYNP